MCAELPCQGIDRSIMEYSHTARRTPSQGSVQGDANQADERGHRHRNRFMRTVLRCMSLYAEIPEIGNIIYRPRRKWSKLPAGAIPGCSASSEDHLPGLPGIPVLQRRAESIPAFADRQPESPGPPGSGAGTPDDIRKSSESITKNFYRNFIISNKT